MGAGNISAGGSGKCKRPIIKGNRKNACSWSLRFRGSNSRERSLEEHLGPDREGGCAPAVETIF